MDSEPEQLLWIPRWGRTLPGNSGFSSFRTSFHVYMALFFQLGASSALGVSLIDRDNFLIQ